MLYFERWKVVLILLISIAGVLFTLPNFFPASSVERIPDWIPHRQLVLGLDLQGGSHILLEVDRASIVRDRIDVLRDDMRNALREARIGYTGLGNVDRGAQVRIRDQAQVEEAVRVLGAVAQPVTSLFGASADQDVELENRGDGLIVMQLTEDGIAARVSSAVDQSIEIVRRRVDELGTTEPSIQRQGQDRILVQVPGLQEPERLKALLGQTARLTFRLVDTSMSAEQALQSRPPADSEVLNSTDEPPVPYLVERRILVSGEDLVDAQPGFDQTTNEPIVSFRFDTSGARRFGQVTQTNVGRPFAIVLDENVISAPVIREPILGGSGQISGNFTVESANDLAVLLRAGALPAPLTVLEERTVGPGLGADSIAAGGTAAIIGFVAVVAFMMAVYGLFGLFANIALVVNIGLIISALSILQATLTLPGIAGIVLTVGMAVDSNVIIFERIRDEVRAGRSAISAIDIGFSRAMAAILDANITTLIAALVLFQLGSGPVRGFAVTLAIGIVTTVFTAYTLTRWLIAQWVRSRRPSAVPI